MLEIKLGQGKALLALPVGGVTHGSINSGRSKHFS